MPFRFLVPNGRRFLGTLVVAALLLAWGCGSWLSAQDLKPAEAQAIATEAYVYGFPIVENYKTMYAFVIDQKGDQYKAPFNTIKNEAPVFSPKDTAIVTPNVDTPYSSLWMDLRAEPIILSVPDFDPSRYHSIQLVDLYTHNFDYIGSRTTGSKAGKYMIAGPDWQGKKPDEVTKVIRCETQFALAIYRTQLFGPDDVENVKSIRNQYTIETLSELMGTATPAPSPKIDFPEFDTKPQSDFASAEHLNFALQFCPPHASETELMARLAKIGIGPGKKFDASSFSPEIQKALRDGIVAGETAIATVVPKANSADIFGNREFLKNEYLKRAVAAKVGLYGNSKEEALHPLYLTDASGKPLDGSKQNYVINFAADKIPPAKAFWSLTMYEVENQGLVVNPIGRYLINSQMLVDLKRNADGGLTLFIQHESPGSEDGDEKESNWLPAPDGPFYLVMRLYWPEPKALDGSWTAPLVWSEGEEKQKTIAVPKGAGTAQEVKPSVLADEPKPEMERPTIWGEPTEVKFGIYVIDIDQVNTADQSFAGSIFLVAVWNNPFLRHKGPGPMHRGLSEVWNPRLTIIGQQNVWRSFPEFVEIEPDGRVIYRQKLWGNFSQPMNLPHFPRDQQKLTVHVVAAGLSEQHIKMVPLFLEDVAISNIADNFSVPDFVVTDWRAESQSYFPHKGRHGTAGYLMEITVKRSPTYFILKVIIPLCLIVIMSWLPRWIDPEQIGTNIGISTTAFLTLVAYLFAITVLLPKVSYVTRIDRFILLSTFLVFVSLIQTVANTSLVRSKKNAIVERTDLWSRMIYPVILVVVLAYSFYF